MFKLVKKDTFEWPVTIHIPQGGRHVDKRFTAEFRFLDLDDIEEAITDDADFVRRVLAGWHPDFTDADGEPIPFTEETLDQAARTPFIASGIVRAFFDAMGGKEAKRKNSR